MFSSHHAGMTPAQKLQLVQLLQRLTPLENKFPLLPSYWLAQRERENIVVLLVIQNPAKSAAFWDAVLWVCHHQEPGAWLCMKYQANPTENILQEVQRIFALRQQAGKTARLMGNVSL